MKTWTQTARERLLSRRSQLAVRPAEERAKELAQVDAALARLDDGSYGRCLICDGPVGRQRLLAVPEVSRCLRCQDLPAVSAPVWTR